MHRLMSVAESIRIGTSAFTAEGWEGSFYPRGMKPADFLSYYATIFDTVEVDSTFYRTPALSTVKGWYAKTPPGFVFAVKIPQVITHEKVLRDCEDDLSHFLETMDALEEKLGPVLFQFGYFNKSKFKSGAEFLARLKAFLEQLPEGSNLRWRFGIRIGWTRDSRGHCGSAEWRWRCWTRAGCRDRGR